MNVLTDWIFSWKRILSLEVKVKSKSKTWFYWRVFDVVPWPHILAFINVAAVV